MRNLHVIAVHLCMLVLACGHPDPENKFLSDNRISQNAKDYYLGKFTDSDDERSLSIVDSLNTKNDSTRYFYFLNISKMLSSADGALSEALGNSSKIFLENHPNDLIEYLYLKDKVVDTNRIKSWARTIAGEFLINCENSELNCVNLSRMVVEKDHVIQSPDYFHAFYKMIDNYTVHVNVDVPKPVNDSVRRQISEIFNQWKISQLSTGKFATENACNPDSALKDSSNSPMMGIPKEVKFIYSDINQDGILDGLALFEPEQCDGGNALMSAQFRVLILSGANGYKIDDTLIGNVERHLKKGFLIIERAWGGVIYGRFIDYKADDGRCCPEHSAGYFD